MLLGQYRVSLTHKGRLAVPFRFRRELGNRLVISRWVENCLVGVSEEGLSLILESLLGKREISSLPVREIERFILGSAFEVEFDAQGRILVPQVLQEYARLKAEVIFVGLGNRFEIWSAEDWDKKQELIKKDAVKMMEQLSRVGIKV